MPFIRYTRDKRGYECTVVLHAYRPQQGPQRTRVLYLFRSPSQLKIGRRPLDPEVVEALEHTHPDLSFDWTALVRDGVTERPERPGRPDGRDRLARRQGRAPATPVEPKPVIAIDDQTPLGRVAGGAEAARLRRAYRDLLDRVSRRARTPEDRDRLTERAHRLNPDDWVDDDAVRAGISTLDADWEAIAAELPQRRRGRRGGRRRTGERPGDPPSAAAPSGIMAESGDSDGDSNTDTQAEAGADAPAVPGGDGGGVGLSAAAPAAETGASDADDVPQHD